MNATHLRIISCPREGGEMTGYNPDQQPKCGLTESAFRDDRLKPFFSNLLTKRFRPCQNQGDWTQQGRLDKRRGGEYTALVRRSGIFLASSSVSDCSLIGFPWEHSRSE